MMEPKIGPFLGYHEGCGGEVFEYTNPGCALAAHCEDCEKHVAEDHIVKTEAECWRCPDCDGLTENPGHLCNQCKAEGREEREEVHSHGGSCAA